MLLLIRHLDREMYVHMRLYALLFPPPTKNSHLISDRLIFSMFSLNFNYELILSHGIDANNFGWNFSGTYES